MTACGLRIADCGRLNEPVWHPDLIELQLVHTERNEVCAASSREQQIEDWGRMIQAGTDYVDELPQRAFVSGLSAAAGARRANFA
jgi:hypothetical protein